MFVGLQDAYALLQALRDDLGQRFQEMQLDNRERSPLASRNHSILAHGFEPVKETTFQAVAGCSLGAGRAV